MNFEKKVNKVLQNDLRIKRFKKLKPFRPMPPKIEFIPIENENLTETEIKIIDLLMNFVNLEHVVDFSDMVLKAKMYIVQKALRVGYTFTNAANILNINRTTLTEMDKHNKYLVDIFYKHRSKK